jgi:hypothetical protein
MRIVIDNDKTIFVTADAYVGNRAKQIHVYHFQGSCPCHDILCMVMCCYLLSGLTCSTRPIFLKNNNH